MKTYKLVEVVRKDTDTVVCNQCTNKMSSRYGLDGLITGGYDSTALEDCTRYEFDLCEPCLVSLFNSFLIPVEKTKIGCWD